MRPSILCPLVMHFMSSCDIDPGFQDSVDESNINIWRKYRKQRTCGKFLNVWHQHPFSSSPDFWITDRKNWLSRIIRFVSYTRINPWKYAWQIWHPTLITSRLWQTQMSGRIEGLIEDRRIDEPHPPSDEDIDISTEDAAFRDQISLDIFPLPCLPAAA